MAEYVAPLRDLRFAINELADLSGVAALPGFGEANAELAEAILEEAGKFATGVLSPLNWPGDQAGARFDAGVVSTPAGFSTAYQQFVEGGWPALGAEPEHGGQGLPHLISAAVSEIWNGANLSFALCPMLTTAAVNAIARHGNEQQQACYLPKLISGEWTGTMNLTEPQAGSDLSAVRARAVPEGDHFRVHGTKIFITYGEHDFVPNIVHLVLARTPGAPEGVKGISLFIVPKFLVNADGSLGERNDVRCVSIEHKLGIHASPTCVMSFGDGAGAVGYLVGEENRGLAYMFTMMNLARIEVGVEGLAIAERAYQRALAFARDRVQGRDIGARQGDRVAIIHHPDVRRMLLTMKAQVEAMRALSSVAVAALDHAQHNPDTEQRQYYQGVFDLLTPVIKGWCTEQSVEIASLGIQIHGGMGFVEETGAAQYLRDARITPIYEGTTGIQANDLVGRKVALEKGLTARQLLTQMAAVERELAAASDADLVAIAGEFAPALASLVAATEWVLAIYGADVRAASAGAVPYLKLWGVVAGGWQMARAALISHRHLEGGGVERDFYRTKLATARFYAEHILPQAQALERVICKGSASVLSLAAERF